MPDRVPSSPAPRVGDGANREIWSVSRLNLQARALLESSFATLWVEGELSNLARPRSGHLYFSLKDEQCQVRCAMFRMHNRRLPFEPRDGLQVLAQARVSMYAERGEFQLIVQHLEEAGAGALRRAFDALKARLAAEGLFDPAAKRALPTLPRQVGVITSPTGAAIRDVLSVLARRFPSLPVLVYPVPVQGADAAPAIVRALERAGSDGRCDVLILTRGGGSLEDLWPFNDEAVARAIARCAVPVVSGVGHEVDFTIADFVADRRAATPSAAAELVSPDAREWRARRDAALRRLALLAAGRLREERQAVAWLLRRLLHPRRRLAELRQRRRELLARLARAASARTALARQRVATLDAKLARHHPAARLRGVRERAQTLAARLDRGINEQGARRRDRLAAALRALESVSPQRTLERGYAIVTRDADGTLLREPRQAAAGDAVTARLAGGPLRLRVSAEPPARSG
jgi:exodeoxyribonuclease VII large subunit